MKCLIIIPAYNEEKNIVHVVESLKKINKSYDYIIINDGSSDQTVEVCRHHEYKLIDLPINLGLAGAFQTGMKYAKKNGYDCAMQYDGDGQHDAASIDKMISCMEMDDADIIIGSRYLDKKKPFSARMIGSRVIQFLIYITTHCNITDPTSGMRMFNKRMIKKLATSVNYGPEPDTIAYLIRCEAKVKEIQVSMNERAHGSSYLNIGNTIRYMLNICYSLLFIQYIRKREL